MRELELKLAVDDPFVTPPALRPDGVDVAGMEELTPLDLRATYYDTSDLRLARNGATLRHRTGEGSDSAWSLKLPNLDEDGASREELHFSGPSTRVPAAALDLVTAFARSAALEPVAILRTERRRWCLRDSDGAELAELVDDRVSVIKDGHVADRFRELEIESRSLDRPGLERIAAVLREAGASAPQPVPKLVRALGNRATLLPDVVAPPQVGPHDPAAYAVQAALARGVQRMIANDPGTRMGEVEPLHQMRVGGRRLRSDLRTFGSLVDPHWAGRLRDELRWIGEALGEVRDLDVMQSRLRASADGLESEISPLFGHLDEQHLVARARLLNTLRTERYVRLLDDLVEAARSPALTPAAWQPSEHVLPPLVAETWGRLARRARSLDAGDPDERFHQVRIRAKRARYAAEAVAPALGPESEALARSFSRRTANLQDALGALQDSVVARGLVADVVAVRAGDARFALAAGRLLEREEQASREAKKAFPKMWKKLDKPKLRRWFLSDHPAEAEGS